MNPKERGEFKLRLSTVFLLLSLFCLIFEFAPVSQFPGEAGEAVKDLFQTSWKALIFGQFGPLWSLIGAAFAFIGIAVNFKKARVVWQSSIEIALCLIAFILFPVY